MTNNSKGNIVNFVAASFHTIAQRLRTSIPLECQDFYRHFYTVHYLEREKTFSIPIGTDNRPFVNANLNLLRSCPTFCLSLLSNPTGWATLYTNNMMMPKLCEDVSKKINWETFCLTDKTITSSDFLNDPNAQFARLVYHLPIEYHKFVQKILNHQFLVNNLLTQDIPPMFWNLEDFISEYKSNETLRHLIATVQQNSNRPNFLGIIDPIVSNELSTPIHVYTLLKDRQETFSQRGFVGFGRERGSFVYQYGQESQLTNHFDEYLQNFVRSSIDDFSLRDKCYKSIKDCMSVWHEEPFRFHIHLNMCEDLLNLALN